MDEAAGIPNASRSSPIHESSLPEEACVSLEEMMSKAAERVETQISTKPTRIHKFPHHMRGISGSDERYVVPTVVAIGPYHHGKPHLQAMEEVKLAAAHSFCQRSCRQVKEVYEKIVSIAGDARRCYTVNDGTSLMATMTDAEFAAMMFLDGCFLMQLMTDDDEPPIVGCLHSSGPNIYKDVFLLENQVPWMLLQVLMEFRRVEVDDVVYGYLFPLMVQYFFERQEATLWSSWFQRSLQALPMKCNRVPQDKIDIDEECTDKKVDSKPPHLLGLLWFRMTLNMPSQRRRGVYTYGTSRMLSNSAVYLAQIGMKLTPSKAAWFPDMDVRKKPLCGELSLSPLFLSDLAACCLVNLAGLEAAQATNNSNDDSDGCVVTSYISVLAMLMDREDVHELRGKGVLISRFSNAKTLAFFKDFAEHIRFGFNYYAVMEDIDDYIKERPLRIAVYMFVYKHHKLIVTVLTIASVLAGIFKALYSLKRP